SGEQLPEENPLPTHEEVVQSVKHYTDDFLLEEKIERLQAVTFLMQLKQTQLLQ
ncbi:unnamed protein product, partial [Amoebophrya sp. A120]